MSAETGIGAAVKRREDLRFITGRGTYTDDLNVPGQTYGVFLRSPYARAKINAIDAAQALQVEGALAVFTGQDTAAAGLGDLPCGWLVKSKDGSDMVSAPHPPLAVSQVNYVGEPFGLVVAESLAAAREAAELVAADFEELTPVVATAEAAQASPIHEGLEANLAYDWELGDEAATDAALAAAAHVTRLDLTNNRLIPNAIEPRAALATFDPASGEYELRTTSQNPHLERLVLSAFVQIAPEHKLRVVAPDVGGGFGSKIFVYAEETVVTWAAAKVGRPIKWTAERSESFLADAHARDHVTHAELGLDEAGRFTALKVRTTANLGAYLSLFGSSVPTFLYGTLLAGQYKTPNIHVQTHGVYTNTAPVDAYRGAGRPEATFVVERIVEAAARETGRDPAELRRLNMIEPGDFPYETPVALVYDTGNYQASLDRALQLADYGGFKQRRAASEAEGKRRGIGFSCYIEACGLAPSQLAIQLGAGVGLYESGEIRINPTGSVTVFTGSHSHGQGHETTFAQVVSDKLGVPFDDVEVVHGDTGRVEFGLGTYGSRSLAVGGSALISAADKIIAKGTRIAAHMMQAEPDNVAFEAGAFISGNQRLTLQEVAFASYVPADYPPDLEPGLSEKAFYDPENFTYPAGAHIAEVEVDEATGVVQLVNFVAVDDFGQIINPMIVDGQVHGGLAQGAGQALLEHGIYDADGQLTTGSYMDYCMPRADDVPDFTVDTTVTPCTHNPLGVKGCGEAGAIGSPAAIINAVTDALGTEDVAMPATPEQMWRKLRGL
ncbi:MAG: xanthine dehydrogenase family protein molybdopterin-binding subunit [Gammaproteobacteria bacterium]|nr:xanthine dehydrogenase family protein molybdopterin-binding subunit [Gammaproteobacteria bacterium]MYK82623.1 xanthine dehydrogenase family protein molybdopterin-binding subunit [Gammaproteobacteria bacterium]